MIQDCRHGLTYLSSLTESLWGPGFGYFCKDCGQCLTDPTIPSRPDEARQARALDALADACSNEQIDIEQLAKSVGPALERWIGADGPFRRGLTTWG